MYLFIHSLNGSILCNLQLVAFTAEPQRQFEIVFKMMDHDGSNYIDKSEFLQVLFSFHDSNISDELC